MSQNEHPEIPDYSLERLQKTVEKLYPRDPALTEQRVGYIRDQLKYWQQTLLPSLEAGLKARDEGVQDNPKVLDVPYAILAEGDQESGISRKGIDGEGESQGEPVYPTRHILPDLSARVTDEQVESFYNFLSSLEARGLELERILSGRQNDEIEKTRARNLRKMQRINPFFYDCLIPFLEAKGEELVKNTSNGRFYYPFRPMDVRSHRLVPIDSNFEMKLKSAIGGIESSDEALNEPGRGNWTHSLVLNCIEKDPAEGDDLIYLNIQMGKGLILQMRAKYSNSNSRHNFHYLRAQADQTEVGNEPVNLEDREEPEAAPQQGGLRYLISQLWRRRKPKG